MNDTLQRIYQVVDDLESSGSLKKYRVVSSPQDPWFIVDGQKVLNLCSNNYLGLASDNRIRKSAIEAIEK